MDYRKIPKLDINVGVVGLGCEHLDTKPYSDVERTLHAAVDAGVNIIDVFMPGDEVRGHIGRALKGRRGDVMIQGMIGSTDVNQQYDISRDPETCRRYFESLLRLLGTDYIDFGMLFFVDTEDDYSLIFEKGELLRYAQDMKSAGIIRGIGASSHNPLVARRMVETGFLDLLMFSVNPAFDLMPAGTSIDTMLEDRTFGDAGGIQPERMELYRACEREGVAVTTMKTYGAGKLLHAAHTPFSKPMTPAQCISYALDRPAVVSALTGCATPREVDAAMRYFDEGEEGRSYSGIISGGHENFKGSCVYCNHCRPCPAEIDIAAVTRYLDIALLNSANIAPSVRQHYMSLKARGGDCVNCGSCEERCPFAVPVMANMARAFELFGA